MKIIITMSGEGSRFKNIGFKVPKHEIIAKDKTLFEWSMLSLKDFFDEDFIFIVRKGNYDAEFIKKKSISLGIKSLDIVEVDFLTEGQASTAILADNLIEADDSIAIYNIDTYIDEYIIKKDQIKENMDGFIPSFDADGDKWSFVKVDENFKVSEVSEKVRISNLGTVGFYYFKKWEDYKNIYNQYKEEIKEKYNEVYIAPMYQYMIDKGQNIYASLIEGKYLHVLGTPQDIEQFDVDYLQKNFTQKDYKKLLKSDMQFDKLKKFYLDNIESNDELLLEYIIYLSNTGEIKELFDIVQKYNLRKKIKKSTSNNKKDLNIIIKMFPDPKYSFFGKKKKDNKFDLLTVDYDNKLDKETIEIIQKSNEQLQEELIKKQKEYFNKEHKKGLTPFVIEYLINELIAADILKRELITIIVEHIAYSKKYNGVRKKYLFYKLFEYQKQKNPSNFIFQNKYTSIQKFHYILEAFDYKEYELGIRKYWDQLVELHKVELQNWEVIKLSQDKIKKDKPKVAVCISGATRFNVTKLLKEFKKKMVDPLDADVFVYTWDVKEDYAGLSGLTIDPNFKWADKYFENISNDIPEAIKLMGGFKKELPLMAQLFETPIKTPNKPEVFTKIFNDCKVEFGNEKEFEQIYDGNEDFIRRGNLNQAKMFYSMYKCNKMLEKSPIEYDYVIRARVDWVPYKNVTFDLLKELKEDELGMNRNPLVGPTDLMFFGQKKTMDIIFNLWENAVNNKNLSPFLVNSNPIACESHRLLDLWMFSNKIKSNVDLKLEYSNYIASTSVSTIPEYEEILEKDIKDKSEQEKQIYRDCFKKIYTNYNK